MATRILRHEGLGFDSDKYEEDDDDDDEEDDKPFCPLLASVLYIHGIMDGEALKGAAVDLEMMLIR